MTTQYKKTLEEQERKVRVIFISSYIPRKCGIATFTKDLTNALNVLNPYSLAEILAINDDNNQYDYPWEVKFRIRQNSWPTYVSAAAYINDSSAEIVCLQHEFGLFGGRDGEYIVKFLEKIRKPIVVTFHTIPEVPTPHQREIIQRIGKVSSAVVVMINSIVDRLEKTYDLEREKVVMIPHGVPDIPFGGVEYFKKLTHLKGKFVMSSINLLSANKGLEYAIEAVPKVIKEIPNFVYLVIGETHPVVKRYYDEEYRNKLKALASKLGIRKYIRFMNRYISLDELIEYLRASDIYTTPYLDPQQVASGTLSYAVGAGKACISTPYIYAQEVLGDGRGVLVPFRDSKSISEAIIKLYYQSKFKSDIEKKAYDFGRKMIWPSVALQYLDLFRLILRPEKINEKRAF